MKIESFAQIGLTPAVLEAVNEVGYEAPTAIQAAAIPPLLARRDLVGQARTGTGKTAAFALPILGLLDLANRRPQALVLAPTRELAIQVAEAMQTYARRLPGFHVLPVYGGQSIETQLRHLKRGVHVVVGTPGRLRDHLRRGTLRLDALTTVVLDEADEMLRMGFLEEVEQILDRCPEEKQVVLFSATMPAAIRKIAEKYLRSPVEVRIETETATVDTVSQFYWQVKGTHKLDALTRILEVEDFDAMLVFVRTRVSAVELAEKLEARGFACSPLNGDLSQAQRERTVERLRQGQLDIVVATDVAARGLDVERISHVVNYDIPYDVEAYIHRVGRTARAGRPGKAILFVSPRERGMLRSIERVTRQPIERMYLPSRQDVTDRRVAQLKQTISDTLESQDLGNLEEVMAGYRDEQGIEMVTIAAALAFLAQRERPLLGSRGERPGRPGTPGRTARRSPPKKPGSRREELPDVAMETYRVEVGRDHGVEPGHLVGAITGEADLDGRYIGKIKLFDTFSLVELPAGMPPETREHLQGVRVCGQALRIRRDERRPPPGRPTKQERWFSQPARKMNKKIGKKRTGPGKHPRRK